MLPERSRKLNRICRVQRNLVNVLRSVFIVLVTFMHHLISLLSEKYSRKFARFFVRMLALLALR